MDPKIGYCYVAVGLDSQGVVVLETRPNPFEMILWNYFVEKSFNAMQLFFCKGIHEYKIWFMNSNLSSCWGRIRIVCILHVDDTNGPWIGPESKMTWYTGRNLACGISRLCCRTDVGQLHVPQMFMLTWAVTISRQFFFGWLMFCCTF